MKGEILCYNVVPGGRTVGEGEASRHLSFGDDGGNSSG